MGLASESAAFQARGRWLTWLRCELELDQKPLNFCEVKPLGD